MPAKAEFLTGFSVSDIMEKTPSVSQGTVLSNATHHREPSPVTLGNCRPSTFLISSIHPKTSRQSREKFSQSKCYRGRFSVTPAVLPRTVPCDAQNNNSLSKIKLHREPSPVTPAPRRASARLGLFCFTLMCHPERRNFATSCEMTKSKFCGTKQSGVEQNRKRDLSAQRDLRWVCGVSTQPWLHFSYPISLTFKYFFVQEDVPETHRRSRCNSPLANICAFALFRVLLTRRTLHSAKVRLRAISQHAVK